MPESLIRDLVGRYYRGHSRSGKLELECLGQDFGIVMLSVSIAANFALSALTFHLELSLLLLAPVTSLLIVFPYAERLS